MRPEPDSPYLADASGYRGSAEELLIPDDEAALVDIVRKASVAGIPITISGAGTGLTGGRVPHGGWLISLERLNRIEVATGYAVCGAAVTLEGIRAAAAPSKQFYAPDPTESTASIGGTIATNASGSRSFLYGATRNHVRALRVVLMSGDVLSLRRGEKVGFEVPEIPAPRTTKNTAGYFLHAGMDYLDLFIGAEGTLGIVTEAEVALLPAPAQLFTGVIFFDLDERALDAVDAWRQVKGLRMLEYLDGASLGVLRGRYPEFPKNARAALLIEQEIAPGDGEGNAAEEAWLERLEAANSMMDDSWFAMSAADRERFRRLRHALPEMVNEIVRQRSLLKISSDFAVPIEHNRGMLSFYRTTLEHEFPGQYTIFGHIGDAHVHVNILPASEEESARAMGVMRSFARKSVEFGGTVSAEHGLGKRKRDFLPMQFSAEQIESMKSVKRRLDPQWLLGRGNVFVSPD